MTYSAFLILPFSTFCFTLPILPILLSLLLLVTPIIFVAQTVNHDIFVIETKMVGRTKHMNVQTAADSELQEEVVVQQEHCEMWPSLIVLHGQKRQLCDQHFHLGAPCEVDAAIPFV